jgi:hypothetical protein
MSPSDLIASVGGETVEPAGASGVDERLLGAPWLICAAFHDVFPPLDRSLWPSMACARSAGMFGFCCASVMASEVQLLQV